MKESIESFFQFALTQVPPGKHIVAINFLTFENRYVALLANEGELYPLGGGFTK
jgi:hypothetical protein